MDITICLPSIRTQNLRNLYDSLLRSVASYTFELIVVTPYEIDELADLENVRVIVDKGCPTRCIQIGASQAKGRLFTTASDDGVFVDDAISKAIRMYDTQCGSQDVIGMRYTEGSGMPVNTKAHSKNAYWTAGHHPTLRLRGIHPSYIWAPLLIELNYFIDIGGLDCQFEHYNYCTHDICYRLQNNGSKFYLSPTFIMNCDWDPKAEDYQVILAAAEDDYPKFKSIWNKKNNRFKIDFDNWKQSPEVWRRFQ
jgi:hypothetical protein